MKTYASGAAAVDDARTNANRLAMMMEVPITKDELPHF
jgi:hypothetical protein